MEERKRDVEEGTRKTSPYMLDYFYALAYT